MTPWYHKGNSLVRCDLTSWERCWYWLEKSMPYMQSRADQDTLRGYISRDISQLWIVVDSRLNDIGAILTTVNGDQFMIEMIGGKGLLPLVGNFLPKMEAYMSERYGCKKSMLVGRLGWQKALREEGYVPQLVLCEKAI